MYHCHTNELCIYKAPNKMGLRCYKAFLAYLNLTQGSTFVNNPDCVKKTYTFKFWTAVDYSKENLISLKDNQLQMLIIVVITWIIGGIVSILLLCLGVIRQSMNEEEPADYKLNIQEE